MGAIDALMRTATARRQRRGIGPLLAAAGLVLASCGSSGDGGEAAVTTQLSTATVATTAAPGTTALLVLSIPGTPTLLGNNCILYLDLGVVFHAPMMFPNASGHASLSMEVPNLPSLMNATLAAQAVLMTTVNPPLGLDFTNAVLLTPGR